MTLHRQLHKRQTELKQEGIRILAEAENVQDSQEYYTRFRKFVEDENEIGKTALAQYIIHRRVILDLLAKALKQDVEALSAGMDHRRWEVQTALAGTNCEGGFSTRDPLHAWPYRIRTSMCREKIHLFEKSREFGFKRNGPDGRGLPGE